MEPRIIYDCNDFIVIDKPINYLSVPTISIMKDDNDNEKISMSQKLSLKWIDMIDSLYQDYTRHFSSLTSLSSLTNEKNAEKLSEFSLVYILKNMKNSVPRNKEKFFKLTSKLKKKKKIQNVLSCLSIIDKALIERYKKKLEENITDSTEEKEILDDFDLHFHKMDEIIWEKLKEDEKASNNNSQISSSENYHFIPDVKTYYEKNITVNKNNNLYAVHRLDLETSGVLLFAKSSQFASIFSSWFRKREIHKFYIAAVSRKPKFNFHSIKSSQTFYNSYKVKLLLQEEESVGIIDKAIGPFNESNNHMKYTISSNGKESLSLYTLIDSDDKELFNYCCKKFDLENQNKEVYYLLLFPFTGRSHQLRVHLQSIGCPIIGDSLYYNENILGGAVEEEVIDGNEDGDEENLKKIKIDTQLYESVETSNPDIIENGCKSDSYIEELNYEKNRLCLHAITVVFPTKEFYSTFNRKTLTKKEKILFRLGEKIQNISNEIDYKSL